MNQLRHQWLSLPLTRGDAAPRRGHQREPSVGSVFGEWTAADGGAQRGRIAAQYDAVCALGKQPSERQQRTKSPCERSAPGANIAHGRLARAVGLQRSCCGERIRGRIAVEYDAAKVVGEWSSDVAGRRRAAKKPDVWVAV